MHKSKLFLFCIISTSIFFASSAMDLETIEKNRQHLWTICSDAYPSSPGYSDAIHMNKAMKLLRLQAWTKRNIPSPTQIPTFNNAATTFNEHIDSIHNQAKGKEKIKSETSRELVEKLNVIRKDTFSISQLMNAAKNPSDNLSSGIIAAIINHTIVRVGLQRSSITELEANDIKNIIAKIAQVFLKTEDILNNLDEDQQEGSILIDNVETFLSQFDKAETSVIDSEEVKSFIDTYMKDNAHVQTIVDAQKKIEYLETQLADRTSESEEMRKTLKYAEIVYKRTIIGLGLAGLIFIILNRINIFEKLPQPSLAILFGK